MSTAARRAGDSHAESAEPPADDVQREDAEAQGLGLVVSIENQTEQEVDPSLVRQAIARALRGSPYQSVAVSVAVVDDATIHRLNSQFLNHDYPTDVLSFVLVDEAGRFEGEIIASADAAVRCAAEAGWTPVNELLLYIVHGTLHFSGFDDRSPTEAADMRAAEARVLDEIGVVRSLSDDRWLGPDALTGACRREG